MPLLFPTQGTLNDAFLPTLPFGHARPKHESQDASAHSPQSHRYAAWSTVEDIKAKAGSLSGEAQAELRKSSEAIQAKTGKIELYSMKYYATCTLGGLLACVGKIDAIRIN